MLLEGPPNGVSLKEFVSSPVNYSLSLYCSNGDVINGYAFDFFPQKVHDVIFLFEEQTKATAPKTEHGNHKLEDARRVSLPHYRY